MSLKELERAAKAKRKIRVSHASGRIKWFDEAAAWAQGRNPWVRLPFMLYGVHVLFFAILSYRTLQPRTVFSPIFGMVDFGFSWLNLGIHEIGHVIFQPFGMFIAIFGGSFLQCLVPVVCVLMFYRQRDFFAIAFCALWFGMNLLSVADYIGDTRVKQLVLVSPFPGDNVIHDWEYILTQIGMVEQDTALAAVTRSAGVFFVLAFLAAGSWLLYKMFTSPKNDDETLTY